ncbi:unnamed protein product [Lasius platythorax]|uniref:Myb/SANT-like DNA-binding domain-containing protein n=1 Tax=Lasius platythorax TaxID=488582 RepID=A0AAV2PBB3_9HYME
MSKKRSLWTEILNEMHKGGYKHLAEDALDRKLRNLKKTFRTIKDNNRKSSTGRGRISWEYYDTFEDIFSDDRTINFGPTISSMDPAAAATPQFTQSASTIMSPTSAVTSTAPSSSTRLLASPAPTRLPALVSPVRTPSPAPTRLPALVSPVRTSSPAPAKYVCRIPSISTPPPALSPALTHISSDSFDSTVVDDSFCEENITNSPYTAAAEHSFNESESAFGSLSNSASEYATPTNSASEYATSSRTQRQRKCKEMTSKEAYDVREKLLLMENERIKAITELNKNIEHNNRIQQERNDLLKKLVDKMLK